MHSTNALTLPETNVFTPENRPKPNRKVVFQPSIFRGHVSFRAGRTFWNQVTHWQLWLELLSILSMEEAGESGEIS